MWLEYCRLFPSSVQVPPCTGVRAEGLLCAEKTPKCVSKLKLLRRPPAITRIVNPISRPTLTREELECSQLSTALIYLQTSLNGVMLEGLRTHVRPKGTASREPAHSAEQPGGDYQDAQPDSTRPAGSQPPVSTSCPPQGTARAAAMPPMTVGTHQNIIYVTYQCQGQHTYNLALIK